MGFYIQDDYYAAAIETLSKREQEQFWSALVRYYFNPSYDVESERLPKAVKGMFCTVKVRIDKARVDAERKRTKRARDADCAQTVHGQSADSPRTFRAGPIQSESEREKEREIVDVDVLETSRLEGADEIGYDPRGFAHFMAESIRLYNEATGQLYMSATAAARQGMLDAFKAGRTIDDVKRVMDDVATWPSNMQTLNGVFADGKFEQHVNFVGGGGADVPDWSEFNDLVTRVS